MSSNSFHDLIDLDVVHYSFELARRIATMSDKIHAIKLSHFIKLFLYSIQNCDSTFFFQAASSCEHNEKTKYRNSDFENSLIFEKYMWESKISRESFVNVLFYWIKFLNDVFVENSIKIHIWKIVKI